MALAVVVLGGAAFLARSSLLGLAGDLCVRDDAPAPGADLIVLLMGELETRPLEAARLYAAGIAPRILLARTEGRPKALEKLMPNEAALAVGLLTTAGVPASAIEIVEVPYGARSTLDEADAMTAIFAGMTPPPARIVLVTSWYHTARSGRAFEAVAKKRSLRARVEVVPSYTPGTARHFAWWRDEAAAVSVFSEYVKSALYFWRYGI